jgi:sorting nexin-7/30/sorting nexin-8
MPNKKIGGRRFESDFVDKRMKFLERFVKGLVSNEEFKASEPLIAFLSMEDRNQFEFKMKELTTFIPSQYIEDIKTLSGTLNLLEDDGNDQYYKNISNYFKLQSQLFERMNYNLKNYYYNTEAACANLEEVQKDFETLASLNSKVLMKEEITKTYEQFGIFYKNWRRILYNQNENMKLYVRDFFKFTQMECNSYEELVKSREALKVKYISEFQRLQTKKDKLWTGMDVSKWEIVDEFDKVDRMLLFRDKTYACAKMCTRETQVVESLHKQVDYANYMNNEELKRMIENNCVKYLENVKEFTDVFYPTLNDSLEVWTNLASFTDVQK